MERSRILDGSLGAIACAARAASKGLATKVSFPSSINEVIAHYESTFMQVTLLATFRDLFSKIGSDFDAVVRHKEVHFSTGNSELPELPHNGVGAWGRALAASTSPNVDAQWRSLMQFGRDLWLDTHRSLYLPSAALAKLDGGRSARLRTVHLNPFSRHDIHHVIRKQVSNKKARQLISSLIRPTYASVDTTGVINLYLFPTFGTFQIDWKSCIEEITNIGMHQGAVISWDSPVDRVELFVNGNPVVVNNQAVFGG